MSADVFIVEAYVATIDTSRNIHAPFHLKLGERAFPDARWEDFVVVVLGWWATRLALNTRGRVAFMDGPYSVDVAPTGGEILTLRGVRRTRTSGGVVECEVAVARSDLLRSYAKAARRVLDVCRKQHWHTADVRVLEAGLARLDRIGEPARRLRNPRAR